MPSCIFGHFKHSPVAMISSMLPVHLPPCYQYVRMVARTMITSDVHVTRERQWPEHRPCPHDEYMHVTVQKLCIARSCRWKIHSVTRILPNKAHTLGYAEQPRFCTLKPPAHRYARCFWPLVHLQNKTLSTTRRITENVKPAMPCTKQPPILPR